MLFHLPIFIYGSAKKPDEEKCKENEQTLAELNSAHRHSQAEGTDESTLVMDSSIPLMGHDPDRSWISDPDPDHPKATHP